MYLLPSLGGLGLVYMLKAEKLAMCILNDWSLADKHPLLLSNTGRGFGHPKN